MLHKTPLPLLGAGTAGRAAWCQLAPAPSRQRGFPDNGRAALYIIWDLQNKLEGLENPPAIVGAQSLLNFLV